MADLVLYGSPLSPFFRKVATVMNYKGLEFDFTPATFMPLEDWFKEISPLRLIPVLRYKKKGEEGRPGTIPDSSAMVLFLERLSPEPPIFCKDPFDAGRAAWIEEYADSEAAKVFAGGIFRPMVFPRFQGNDSDTGAVKKVWTNQAPAVLDYLESEITGKSFFAGDVLSIGDIAICCQLAQTKMVCDIDLTPWPSLNSMLNKVMATEAFKSPLDQAERQIRKLLPEKFDLTDK